MDGNLTAQVAQTLRVCRSGSRWLVVWDALRSGVPDTFDGYIARMVKLFCKACSIEAFKSWQGWAVDVPSHLGSFKKPPRLPN
jgi:hypothetical protein